MGAFDGDNMTCRRKLASVKAWRDARSKEPVPEVGAGGGGTWDVCVPHLHTITSQCQTTYYSPHLLLQGHRMCHSCWVPHAVDKFIGTNVTCVDRSAFAAARWAAKLNKPVKEVGIREGVGDSKYSVHPPLYLGHH